MVPLTSKVCVVIPTWNHKEDVTNLLGLILASDTTGFELKVCVVDNGSTDGTVEAIESKYPNVILLKNSENLGFVKACNAGMKWGMAQGYTHIVLLNDDTLIDKNLIKNILLEHNKDPKIGAISPKIYFAKGYEFHKKYSIEEMGKVIWYAGGKLDWDNVYGSNKGVDEVDSGQFNETSETDFATGCFVMYKTEALQKVGLYNEKFFAYMEDVEYSIRLKKSGWKVLYSPAGVLWHKVSQSSGIGSEMNDYYLTRNRLLFGLKYAPLRAKLALIRESLRFLFNGRKWQKIGARDYYLGKFSKGSWIN